MSLEEHVSGKNTFWSTLIGKIKERKKFDFPHIVLLSYQTTSTANRALSGQIGCADWVVTQKGNMGFDFFSFPAFVYNSRPKCIFCRDMFFKRHFKLVFHSVVKIGSTKYSNSNSNI